MKPEQRLWRHTLRPALVDIRDLMYERIELKTGGSGIPDVMYTYGATGWIENKWSASHAHIDLSGWNTAQRRWAKNHVYAGANLFLFVGTPLGSHLIRVGLHHLDPYDEPEEIRCDHPGVVHTFDSRIDRATLSRLLYLT